MGTPRASLRAPVRPLVGRSPELSQIADALGSPETTGVVLIGPGGVGKTHLARHALTTASASGFAVAEILATQAASSVPLGALEPILGREHEGGTVGALRSAQAHIRQLSDGWPLVLLIDDAHLLDDVSATVVLNLASDDQVFVVATVRSGEHVPDPVTALWKDAGAQRIDVAALSVEGTETLVRHLVGGAVAMPTLRRLIELSGGLPMTVCELVEAARRTGTWRERDGVWEIDGPVAVSERLVDLVQARLSGCTEPERDALALVALGDPLPLAAATALTSIEVLTALETQELIAVSPGGDVSVAHPIYGEVAVSSLGELQRRSLLTSLADAVASTKDPSPTDDLRVAIWRLAAGGDVGADVLLRGAEIAYRSGDHSTASRLAGAAWEHSASAAAGHLHGLSLSRLGRSADAEGVLSATAEIAAAAGDERAVALVALARSENMFRGCNNSDEALRIVAAAEAITSGAWRDELVGHRAMLVLNLNRVDETLALTAPLLGEGVPDRVSVRAAYAAGIASAYAGRTDDAAVISARALPIHERVWKSDLFQTEPAVHHITAMLSLIESGQLHSAEAYSDIAVQVAAETGESYGLGYMSLIAGLVAMRRGHMVTARRRCVDAVPLFRSAGYVAQMRWALGGAATAAAMCGDVASARQYLEAVDRLRPDTPMLLNEHRRAEAHVWLLVAEGDFATARSTLVAAAEDAAAAGARAGAAELFHTVGRLGDPVGAIDGLRSVGAMQGELHQLRLDHMAAVVAGDGSELEAVALRFDACGADLLAAEAGVAAVRAHRRGGDARAATRLRLWTDEVLQRCEGASTPATVLGEAVDPLTDREREVALLAAGGMSSKDIAERLFVSRRTVDNHLQKVFAKLGISSRADLPSALGLD